MKIVRKGMLLVISGPSGAGKGTLAQKLIDIDPSFVFSVSATTRAPRDNEIPDVHYHFMTDEKYDELLREDAFLEHATVHGHRYGTLRSEVASRIESGKNVLLDIDTQGAINVMHEMPDCVSVFIMPPSMKQLRSRLYTRNTDSTEEIEKRLRNAKAEIEKKNLYDYIVINDHLELSFEQFSAIVRAEKQKSTRFFPQIEDLDEIK